MATDFLGQTLNIGDDVIFLNYNGTSANLERGKITKLFPHAAEIGMKRRAEYKIVKIPTNVAPVVHGRWERSENESNDEAFSLTDEEAWYYWKCSVCHEDICYHDAPMGRSFLPKYCPNCGAKMDGGADHEDD